MASSKIEWCDRVWNPVTGCTPISPGCDNCYAERMSKRFAEPWGLNPNDPFKVTLRAERLEEPLRWKKPSRIFVCSMADLFHDDVPFEFLAKVWEVFFQCGPCKRVSNDHIFLVLTKRPERMLEFSHWYRREKLLPVNYSNVWLGVTAENQEQADKRIPILLTIPAAVRFVSVEPMLSKVKILDYLGEEVKRNCHGDETSRRSGLDWVICGGESGPGARPMHPDWIRLLRDHCQDAGVPFLFKQWGEWSIDDTDQHDHTNVVTPYGKHLKGIPFGFNVKASGSAYVYRVGKKKAGRLLDGELWDQYPEVGVCRQV